MIAHDENKPNSTNEESLKVKKEGVTARQIMAQEQIKTFKAFREYIFTSEKFNRLKKKLNTYNCGDNSYSNSHRKDECQLTQKKENFLKEFIRQLTEAKNFSEWEKIIDEHEKALIKPITFYRNDGQVYSLGEKKHRLGTYYSDRKTRGIFSHNFLPSTTRLMHEFLEFEGSRRDNFKEVDKLEILYQKGMKINEKSYKGRMDMNMKRKYTVSIDCSNSNGGPIIEQQPQPQKTEEEKLQFLDQYIKDSFLLSPEFLEIKEKIKSLKKEIITLREKDRGKDNLAIIKKIEQVEEKYTTLEGKLKAIENASTVEDFLVSIKDLTTMSENAKQNRGISGFFGVKSGTQKVLQKAKDYVESTNELKFLKGEETIHENEEKVQMKI